MSPCPVYEVLGICQSDFCQLATATAQYCGSLTSLLVGVYEAFQLIVSPLIWMCFLGDPLGLKGECMRHREVCGNIQKDVTDGQTAKLKM